eukprot:TRINITY_DN10651_c0_g1_i2.p1 TRINITY_DN10651_c0_g1~~TRINITY_DN10651_c0_g1_i2.p1  ORF type:complete len:343 (+),score=96.60 TRINITY_DN10651_c0_g1_i2:149-1030(+)
MAAPSSYDHVSHRNRVLLADLRGSLKNNMKEFLGMARPEFVENGEIERLDNISADDFNDYFLSSKPFILSNPAIRCSKHQWTLDFIEEMAGDDVVGVETSKSNKFYSNEGLKKVRMSVREFLNEFRRKDRNLDLYLAEENIKQFPKLDNDTVLPDFCYDYNLDKTQLWVGAGGQVSPLHQDQWDNVLCQVQGTRELTLFDPFQIDRLYPKSGVSRHFSQVDPSKPDLERFPRFAETTSYRVVLEAGEILFVPAHWWHQVHSRDSVNVAINFWFMPSLLGELLVDVLLPPGPNY